MKNMTRCALAAACVLVLSSPLFAASFIVGPDRTMVEQAPLIVVASALSSHAELRQDGSIDTTTVMSIGQVLKGSLDRDTIDVHEPGGVVGKVARIIPGVPRFHDGNRLLLFLIRGAGTWHVLNLDLGKFTFTTDEVGHEVLVRDAGEIDGWDSNGTPHREKLRAAQPFLDYVRATVAGASVAENYYIPGRPLSSDIGRVSASGFKARTLSFAPSSYTYDFTSTTGSGNGVRWNSFPVTFMLTNANSAAVTATNTAMNSWNSNAGSNINLVNGGNNSGSSFTGDPNAPDGQNTIAFEVDLSGVGAPALSCGSNSYSGVLGLGGVSASSGSHNPSFDPTETFATASEGDIQMNKGTSTCAFFLGTGDFNSAVVHELGHAIGFRHADESRVLDSNVSCNAATSECSSTALMIGKGELVPIPSGKNGVLQPWDQNAAKAVYPGVACTAPSISTQPTGSTIASGGSAALSVTATGTAPLTYQWYLGNAGDTSNPIGGATASTYNTGALTSTKSYWVRVGGCSTFVNSTTATVTVLGTAVNSGDVNGSGTVTSADVFYLINYLFAGGPAPVAGTGDANNDGAVNAGDVIYLLRYLFAGGNPPH